MYKIDSTLWKGDLWKGTKELINMYKMYKLELRKKTSKCERKDTEQEAERMNRVVRDTKMLIYLKVNFVELLCLDTWQNGDKEHRQTQHKEDTEQTSRHCRTSCRRVLHGNQAGLHTSRHRLTEQGIRKHKEKTRCHTHIGRREEENEEVRQITERSGGEREGNHELQMRRGEDAGCQEGWRDEKEEGIILSSPSFLLFSRQAVGRIQLASMFHVLHRQRKGQFLSPFWNDKAITISWCNVFIVLTVTINGKKGGSHFHLLFQEIIFWETVSVSREMRMFWNVLK